MRFAITLTMAAVSGFIALSYEILLYRTISFGLAGAAIVFPMLLGAYLLGIALGARVADTICSRAEAVPSEVVLRYIAGFVLGSNLAAYATVGAIGWLAGAGVHFAIWLLLVTITSAMLGAQFPLISAFGVSADARAGQRVSFVYGANIVGSTLGSLLTGVIILDHFTLADTAMGLVVGGLVAALALYASTLESRRAVAVPTAATLAMVAAAILAQPFLFDRYWEHLLFQDEHIGREFIEVIENKHGVITVDAEHTIYGGGVYDGGFNVVPGKDNHILRAYALGLVHRDPKRVLMIGLSSGSWATVVANHPDVDELVVVEINPGYLELLPKYSASAELLTNPKVKIVIDDGRKWLTRHPEEKFDAVVANYSHNWRNLSSNLLSREYNDLIATRLNPGGVYIWNTTTSERVFRTAFDTWDHVARFQTCAIASNQPIEPDHERWRGQLQGYTIWGEPLFVGGDGGLPDAIVEATKNVQPLENRDEHFAKIWEPTDALRDRVEGFEPITDDNMGTEWTGGLYER